MKMVALNTSAKIGTTLNNYFGSHTGAQIKKLKVQLENPKNNGDVRAPVFLESRKLLIRAIGAPISADEHIY